MKINFKTILVDLNGEPAKHTTIEGYDSEGKAYGVKEVPLTLAVIVKEALNHVEKEKVYELDKQVEKGLDILQINKGSDLDWSLTKWNEIKTLVKAVGRPPIILGQIEQLIVDAIQNEKACVNSEPKALNE